MGTKKNDKANENLEQETPVPDIVEEAEDTAPAEHETEKSETELLAEKHAELNDRYLRLMAEYDNYRKRTQKEKDEIYPNAVASTVLKFLPAIDNFERASQFDRGTEDFAKGFDLIVQNFKDILSSLGIEEIGVEGEEFNPELHNAAMHIEDENLGKNVVSQVFQKGYKIGGRVIRFAMVQTAN